MYYKKTLMEWIWEWEHARHQAATESNQQKRADWEEERSRILREIEIRMAMANAAVAIADQLADCVAPEAIPKELGPMATKLYVLSRRAVEVSESILERSHELSKSFNDESWGLS